jgi:phosphoribosylglycinamide formyltransferase-1
LNYGAKVAGCTVHFVDEGTDTGPIIIQRSVPVLDNDTAETLHARIQVEEHIAYPEALRRIADGRISVRDGRVFRMSR